MILTLFIISVWLTSTAVVSLMIWCLGCHPRWVIIWYVISMVNYKQMARNIRNAGGGFRGIRKGVRIYHVLGFSFVAFLSSFPMDT